MKRFVFTLLAALLLPVSAVYAQDDCSQVTSSLEMVPCSEAAKKAADTQLNVSYKQLMTRLESDYRTDPALGAEYAAKVKESQRAWLKLSDANCPLEAFEIEAEIPHVFAVNSCIARMSRERSAYGEKGTDLFMIMRSPINKSIPFSGGNGEERRACVIPIQDSQIKELKCGPPESM